MTSHRARRRRGWIEVALGVVAIAAGIVTASFVLVGPPDPISYAASLGPVMAGLVIGALGVVRLWPERDREQRTTTPAQRRRAIIEIAAGCAAILIGAGLGATVGRDGVPLVVELGIVLGPGALGGALLVIGLFELEPRRAGTGALARIPGIGYRTFVAARYLLNREHKITLRTKVAVVVLAALRLVLLVGFGLGVRTGTDPLALHVLAECVSTAFLVVVAGGIVRHSKLAIIVFSVGVGVVFLASVVLVMTVRAPELAPDLDGPEQVRRILQIANIALLSGAGLAALAMFFGTLRGFFTFFTTVPIGGVWIGTAALVLVLAVMSGFETDLREKILGSNAHIQVTKEDGEFVEWREVKAKIDQIPGVVASTPYATSEVVIAANNNGQNVIIKGIDPKSVGRVTDLISDLEDPHSIDDLEPKRDGMPDRAVTPRDTPDVDAPPPDMVIGGDPIDFSGGGDDDDGGDDAGAGSGSAGAAAGSGAGADDRVEPPPPPPPAGDPDVERASPYGGDATRIVDLSGGADALDSDLIRWATGEDGEPSDTVVHVVDVGPPPLSNRTRALAGILVGKELVKQTHLYLGQEVRLVSPLSDPSNPDATGTPIPFNRDYRVAGVFYTGMYEYDLKFVYVTLDSLQDFLDLGDAVDGIEVRLTSPDDTDRYVPSDDSPGLIREALGPGYRVQDWRELNRSLFSALKLEKIAMFLVLVIVILVAGFSIVGNLIMVVVEKAREIALLKTLGASDGGVMQLFAIQGLIIGLIGTALGIATGLLGCWALDEFGLPLDPDVYYINRLPIHVDVTAVIGAAITGVVISIGATLYPSLLAARVRPSAGMRH